MSEAEGAEETREDELGAPKPPGEIDPELIKLSRFKRRPRPVLASVMLIFVGYLAWSLLDDFLYSLKSESDAVMIPSTSGLDNEVGVAERNLDYATAMLVSKTSSGKDGNRLVAFAGTSGQYWLLESGSVWQRKDPQGELAKGRLRSLDALPFGDAVRAKAKEISVSRTVRPEHLKEQLGSRELTLAVGDQMPWSQVSSLTVYHRPTQTAYVTTPLVGAFNEKKVWDELFAAMEIEVVAAKEKGTVVEYEVKAQADQLRPLLQQAGRFEPTVFESLPYQGRPSDFHRKSGGLHIKGRLLPWNEISNAHVETTLQVSSGATVLIVGEMPSDFLYTQIAFAIFALFGGLLIAYLVSLIRATRADP